MPGQIERVDVAQQLIGGSLAIRELRATIARVAPSSFPVLVLGGRGVGKELVATALHGASGRGGRFVAFNACAIPDTMFEDMLFGHVRGAFTGASADVPGYLAEAHGGTAFFDEISGIATANQSKLLRALETRAYRPIGARADRRSDFRLVAATNEDLDALIEDGRFRADLADRLSVVVIRVPPLRERLEDVPMIAAYFLKSLDPSGETTLNRDATTLLMEHDWPGNVRQLKHTLERAILMAQTPILDGPTIALALSLRLSPPSADSPKRDYERRRLVQVMERAEWHIDRAAELLDVDRTTVYRRLRRLGIAAPKGAA